MRARTLVQRNGEIVVDAGPTGETRVAGTLDASGLEPGRTGGTIQVLGHHVGVVEKARLDARGDIGGGTALVGGDSQGRNTSVRNAEATYFGPDATIDVDAVSSGNGGKAIVWSNERHAHTARSAHGAARRAATAGWLRLRASGSTSRATDRRWCAEWNGWGMAARPGRPARYQRHRGQPRGQRLGRATAKCFRERKRVCHYRERRYRSCPRELDELDSVDGPRAARTTETSISTRI